LKKITLFCILAIFSSFNILAATLVETLDSAAEFFVRETLNKDSKQLFYILKIVNLDATKGDKFGAEIEKELRLALIRQSPGINLVEFDSDDERDELYLDGNYELSANVLDLRLSVSNKKRLLAGFSVRFKIEEGIDNTSLESGVSPTHSDLEISFAEEPQKIRTAAINQELEFVFRIINKGNGNSDALQINYFLKNQERRNIIPLADSTSFPTIPSDQNGITWKKKLRLPTGINSGHYQLVAQITLADLAKEKNETNNRVESVKDLIFVSRPVARDLVVKMISPGMNAGNIPLSAEVTTRFNAIVNPQTVTDKAFFVESMGQKIEGHLEVDKHNILFTPESPFQPDSTYHVVIKREIEDMDGNRLKKDLKWRFKTRKSEN